MTESPLVLIAEQCTLPDDDEQKERCIRDIKSALANVFLDYGIYPEGFKFFDGHLYSQVETDCPECNDTLRLRNLEADAENGAAAKASCSCGFDGRAVYRLIDIEQNLDTSTVEALFDPGSAVSDENFHVSYTPYTETEFYYE